LLGIYAKLSLGFVVLALATVGFFIYSASRNADKGVVANCLRSDDEDPLVKQFCENGPNFVKMLPIAFLFVGWQVQLCASGSEWLYPYNWLI
jgi:hypothetical protein